MTTDKSRADALTDEHIVHAFDLSGFQFLRDRANVNRLIAAVRAIIATPAVEQPAAAPIYADARECLMDVVSHHDDFEKACRALKDAASDDGNRNDASYWLHQIDVLDRMKAQAERALTAIGPTAPSPADERAAFDLTDMEWLKVFERVSASIPNVLGSYVKASAAFAREAIRMAEEARASSANETRAEGSTHLAERAHLAAGQWANSNTPIAEALAYRDGFIAGARAPAQAPDSAWRELCHRLYVELFHCDQQMRSTRDEDGEPHWTQSSVVRDVLAGAKAALECAPAQVDAREGLTDEQREAIDFVIGWYEQCTLADNPYRAHITALRALLQGASHV
ncbi:hypothetical protein IST4116A_01239 [Burkholderia cenocepacia]|uniref:hypothetical protein n=1 Tax=Burkholderia cenocepacia TaxID=95486 RepID=UPI0019A2DC0F|nr:hypothetical protein [Burkholderia cenocepacia]CAB5083407.1 hypothetical protein IST4116B_01231 [Burkholderia cenocepacia]CAB5084083.1 hypothetical protein IST4134_01240 [Burkholderia cenocepacia]CAB5088122.1 hypothetical protein IST4113_01238 [Burkholderia cenocepacia]CAB5096182.1 hypothetical protein IST439_01278 [Burkholderia cenocepacia]CAB5105631.1 hypothetical protein IST4129_01239 [Burkholderia cenocepacia]